MVDHGIANWSTNTPGMRRRDMNPPYARRSLKTPSPSSWKESLKAGCLERARRKRHDRVWQGRRLQPYDAVDQNTARRLVEEELHESGIVLESPSLIQRGEISASTPSLVPIMLDGDGNDKTMSSRVDEPLDQVLEEYTISEAEMYELMQEVEEELQRDAQVMEEMELADILERQHIEDQISDFEKWETTEADRPEHDLVLCPICQSAFLLQSEEAIVCPNHPSFCSLGLSAPDLSFADLRDKLRSTYEAHAANCPSGGVLWFMMTQRREIDSLIAVCDGCGLNTVIA